MQQSVRVIYLPWKTISQFEEMSKSFFTCRDEFVVGYEDMDATHRELVSCVDALLCASDDRLEALASRSRRWMRSPR
jgi:hypothetical protein